MTLLCIRFWRSKVKVTAGLRGGECIYVDAWASTSVFIEAAFQTILRCRIIGEFANAVSVNMNTKLWWARLLCSHGTV